MADVVCPTCGAHGMQNCSTKRGNDHLKRIRAELAVDEQARAERKAAREALAGCTAEGCGYPQKIGLIPGVDVSIDGDVWPKSPYAEHIATCPWHQYASIPEPDDSETSTS